MLSAKKDDKSFASFVCVSLPMGKKWKHGGMTKKSSQRKQWQLILSSNRRVWVPITIRVLTMFAAPQSQTLEWIDSGVDGSHPVL